MKKHILLRGLLSLLVISQTGFGGVALAAHGSAKTPTPSASPTPSDSPDPSVSPSPDPTVSPSPSPTDSPAPSDSPAPTASPSPTSTATPSPSPTATPAAAATKNCPATGPCDPTGVMPTWVFNTGTGLWEKADQSSFIYDTTTGYWLSPKYYLDKQDGWYEIIPPAQVASLPSYMMTAPNVVSTPLGDVTVGSTDYQLAKMLGIIPSGTDPEISGTGANSTNNASVSNSNQSWFDLTNLVNVINTLDSSAKSGNATASSNTQVGDAVTGAANVLANLINLLSSAWSWSSGDLNFFMQNLMGNINGDIMLSPTQTQTTGGGSLGGTDGISNTGSGSTNDASVTNSNTLGVNAQNQGNITNNVDLAAASGNASATGNTSAGNVASGNATAEINIINLINSYISSGSSFFGVLNIFGNLNGDVLFPDGFLNGALSTAAGGTNAGIGTTGSGSTNVVDATNSNQANVNNTSAYGLNNNINASANTGTATSSSNTSAGTTSSGNASTNGSTFNLVNSSIFGDNAVLVIVNVLGHWVGKIMTLPGGTSTSALLTDNAQIGNTGANSANNATVANNNIANINQSNTGTITNNVNADATSGNATATDNTGVGNVSTGDAKVSSGVTNIVNSVLNVKHWFGVLVINVFGDWTGDVGDNTSAGDIPAAPVAAATSGVLSAQTAAAANSSALAAAHSTGTTPVTAAPQVASTAPATGQVLAAAAQLTSHVVEANHVRNLNFVFWGAAILMLLAGAMLGIERRLRHL